MNIDVSKQACESTCGGRGVDRGVVSGAVLVDTWRN